MSSTSEPVNEPASEQVNPSSEPAARRRGLIAAVAAVAAVIIAVGIMAVVSRSDDQNDTTARPATAESAATTAAGDSRTGDLTVGDPKVVAAKATGVLPKVYDRVGRGRVEASPQKVTDRPPLAQDGKPLILYIGAEYCPFCASQRWAVVAALSRFGTFSNLGLTRSASDDVYPNTPSFSFHGASYTSRYLAFQGVETATNQRQGNRYAPLDKLTEQQATIMRTLNAPPYVESKGAIPFMDFANRYILVGGTYDVTLLANKSAEQIASALGNPGSPVTQGILGTANMFTGYLCTLTGGEPGEVCQSPAAKAYQVLP